jgi:hypothetical protein
MESYPVFMIGRIGIVKVSILLKAIYGFDEIYQNSNDVFTEIQKKH